eukprot:TRINITY_DN2814_c0_g1_i2.p1 TRINITY_DN2814_c0_g1~~TRINITY_DN2814_c0_g1_i2.p1  ORF type:complete len:439 (+),score=82.45 TRINITY_DN2814_c0_g1_i2:111-1427(+)
MTSGDLPQRHDFDTASVEQNTSMKMRGSSVRGSGIPLACSTGGNNARQRSSIKRAPQHKKESRLSQTRATAAVLNSGATTPSTRQPLTTTLTLNKQPRSTHCHTAPTYSFTLTELNKALPRKCFERDHTIAARQLIQTCLTSGVLLYLLSHTPTLLLPLAWCVLGFSLYGFLAIGHECSHGSFTKWPLVNRCLGSVCMLSAFMPFENWRQAHMLHHRWTAHITNEEYFTYPRARNPIMGTFRWLMTWVPPVGLFVVHMLYLCGLRGKKKNPKTDNLYYNEDMNNTLSFINLAMLSVQCVAIAVGLAMDASFTFVYVLMPLCACGAVNLLIGYLQHRDDEGALVAFDEQSWTKLRGDMQTIDRSFWPFDWMLHGAARYHVCHHLFPAMPHYRAALAMTVLEDLLGDQYAIDERSALIKYHSSLKFSHLVEGEGVLTFKP